MKRVPFALLFALVLTIGGISAGPAQTPDISTIEELTTTPADAISVQAATPRQVWVNCDLGEQLAVELRRARRSARPFIFNITGTCRENVTIDRPDITLRGYGGAVIESPNDDPAVFARGAHNLVLEDLTLAMKGFEALASRGMRLTRVTVNDVGTAVLFNGSDAILEDNDLSYNNSAIVAGDHSTARVSGADCVMGPGAHSGAGYHGSLARASNHSSISMTNCDMTWVAAQAWEHSRIFVDQRQASTIGTMFQAGALRNSSVELNGAIVGRFPTVTSAWVVDASHLMARDTVFFGNITVQLESSVRVAGGEIDGSLVLADFSDAAVTLSSAMTGSCDCTGRSRAFASPSPLGGMTGCE